MLITQSTQAIDTKIKQEEYHIHETLPGQKFGIMIWYDFCKGIPLNFPTAAPISISSKKFLHIIQTTLYTLVYNPVTISMHGIRTQIVHGYITYIIINNTVLNMPNLQYQRLQVTLGCGRHSQLSVKTLLSCRTQSPLHLRR